MKPDNVILRNGVYSDPVIVDFGMAWAASDEERQETSLGRELGNRFIRLPELSAGRNIRDPRSDLTFLVALLFFMISGIRPRLLEDEQRQKPHEAHDRDLPNELRQDSRWPRLQRVFRIAFQQSIEERYASHDALQLDLSRLTPMPIGNVDQEIDEEIVAIAELRDSSAAKLVEARRETMLEASQRFLRVIDGIAERAECGCPGSGPTVTSDAGSATLSFVMQRIADPNIQVGFTHRLLYRSGQFTAMSSVNRDGSEEYYTGQAADQEGLFEAVESRAARVGLELLRHLKQEMRSRLP